MKNIPVLHVEGKSLAETYEKSLLELWKNGVEFKTQYDKPGDPLSKDCTMNMTTLEPDSDPMIHKCFPGGIEDLREYVFELMGVKDGWIKNYNDEHDTRWEYTYSGRLRHWGRIKYKSSDTLISWLGENIDQIKIVVNKLINQPFTRQAQMITWDPRFDTNCYDPACFARGSLVKTPKGEIEIEKLKNGDEIFVYDFTERKYKIDIVTKFFTKKSKTIEFKTDYDKIIVSPDQLIYSDSGNWIEANKLKILDYVALVDNCKEVTDYHVLGFMHGDGWLSSGKNHSRNIKRHDVCFSMHKDSDDSWIYNYLSKNTNNKIICKEKFIKSAMVKTGGTTKKIYVASKELYEKLANIGCIVGKKINQNMIIKQFKLNYEQKIQFLIGLYSAEGCIYITKNGKISIQLGMNWKKCIDYVEELLNEFGITYSRHISYSNKSKNPTYKLYVNDFYSIKLLLEKIDFRLDSRKQLKYIVAKSIINKTQKKHDEQIELYKRINSDKINGIPIKEIFKKYGYSCHRAFNKIPSIRWRSINFKIQNNILYLPITKITHNCVDDVYDFEVTHNDHAIIVNNHIVHNCLQSLWFRLLEDNGIYYLNTNIRFRSNDAFSANFMNQFGFIQFIKQSIIKPIQDKTNWNIKMGRLNWQADSYHIYGKDLADFKTRFLDRVETTSFEDRIYNFNDPEIQMMYSECENELLEKFKNTESQFKEIIK
jgi:thymidylate synthase